MLYHAARNIDGQPGVLNQTKWMEHANAVMILHVTQPKKIEEVSTEDSVESAELLQLLWDFAGQI